MKDLRFFGDVDGTSVDFTLRTDLINDSAENFTVSQIQHGEAFDPSVNTDQKAIESEIQRLPYNLTTFIEFAEDNNLSLTIADSTGEDVEYLYTADESGS